ncbi:MAG: flagellar biosynthesis repressor FlbT [Pseudomonadota bacterium]
MSTLKISVKPNERIFINGAVLRFDRKTSLEFLNDVQFLLENQVLQFEDADTPVKQLYFLIQSQLISGGFSAAMAATTAAQLSVLREELTAPSDLAILADVEKLLEANRLHEAMKRLRRTSIWDEPPQQAGLSDDHLEARQPTMEQVI